MGWTLNATGDAPTPEDERLLVQRQRSMLRNPRLGMRSATLDTDHFGHVDLTSDEMPKPPAPAPPTP